MKIVAPTAAPPPARAGVRRRRERCARRLSIRLGVFPAQAGLHPEMRVNGRGRG